MHVFTPVKGSLVDRVVESVQEAITNGHYADHLPGERTLSLHLRVSRTVVHEALKVLESRGVVSIAHGKRTRIVRGPQKTARRKHKLVCVLIKVNLAALQSSSAVGLLQLQQQLSHSGYGLRVFSKGPSDTGPSAQHLRQLLADNPADCWVLHAGNASLQRFFAKSGMPTFLCGHPHSGINLPCIYVDRGPAVRHAAGTLLAHGHTRIALVMDETPTQRHRMIENNFLAAFDSRAGRLARPQVLKFSPATETPADRLAAIPRDSDHFPTALIANTAADTLTLLAWLSGNGISVPRDISIICLGSHPLLDGWTPRLSHYAINEMQFAIQYSQLVWELALKGRLPGKNYAWIPEFVEGGTVGPPAA